MACAAGLIARFFAAGLGAAGSCAAARARMSDLTSWQTLYERSA
jgi:hypothetical protein